MNANELFKLRKLRKIKPDIEKSKSSINIAENKLSEAKNLTQREFYNQSILSSYTSMFHSARALLYKEGIQEKSHYAILIYLKEKFSRIIPTEILNSFENYMKERHQILYGLNEIKESSKESNKAIEEAEEFLSIIKDLLK
jgi:uncharacterized protein (UPF0332 family)